MLYSLNNELIRVEYIICENYVKKEQLKGVIKTTITESPSVVEFLQMKRTLREALSIKIKTHYIDDIDFKFRYYSRDQIYSNKHKGDIFAFVMTAGMITPILLYETIIDLQEYYMSQDYYYIEYDIKLREKGVESIRI
jgi:hypothetical protein